MNKEYLKPMLAGEELKQAMTILPPYHKEICQAATVDRLVGLSDLYEIYLPSVMSMEIYSKLYLAMLRSIQKKGTKEAVKQYYENYKQIQKRESRGIIGGSDSFTIIGNSGIGKSSAIVRSVSLATGECKSDIVPCVICQCPHDCSVKGMLLEILRKVDEVLESNYYEQAIRSRATSDMLIGTVSTIALNHIGLLIVDEIQNVRVNRKGRNLISMLIQLINNSGISIAMVGTPECIPFFEQEMQMARRALGLKYSALPYEDEFVSFCETVFQYQYVKEPSDFETEIANWLYEHSGGILSVVISLLHDAQEIAILDGTEKLNLNTLQKAYKQRYEMLTGYVDVKRVKPKTVPKRGASVLVPVRQEDIQAPPFSVYDTAIEAKRTKEDAVTLLKRNVTIEEVVIE